MLTFQKEILALTRLEDLVICLVKMNQELPQWLFQG